MPAIFLRGHSNAIVPVSLGSSVVAATGATAAVTLTQAVAVGDVIMGAVAWNNGAGALTWTGADNHAGSTNVYSSGNAQGSALAGVSEIRCVATTALVIGDIVTITFTAGGTGRLMALFKIVKESGIITPLVSAGVNGASGNTTTPTPGAVTPSTFGPCFQFAAYEEEGNRTGTPAAGYTELFDINDAVGAAMQINYITTLTVDKSARNPIETISNAAQWGAMQSFYQVAVAKRNPQLLSTWIKKTAPRRRSNIIFQRGPVNGAATVPVSGSDTAAETDAQSSLTATLPGADTATGVDTQSTLAASLPGADTATGADTQTALSATLPGSESGTVTETNQIGVANTDTAAVTETSSIVATLVGSDTAAETDASINGRSGADTGAGVETGSLTATLAGSDTAAETDSGVTFGMVGSDTGTVTQSTGTIAATLSSSDSATASESSAVNVPVVGSDTGSVADTATLVASVPGADTATAAQTGTIVVTLSSTDAGTVTETSQVGLSGSDSATAADYPNIIDLGNAVTPKVDNTSGTVITTPFTQDVPVGTDIWLAAGTGAFVGVSSISDGLGNNYVSVIQKGNGPMAVILIHCRTTVFIPSGTTLTTTFGGTSVSRFMYARLYRNLNRLLLQGSTAVGTAGTSFSNGIGSSPNAPHLSIGVAIKSIAGDFVPVGWTENADLVGTATEFQVQSSIGLVSAIETHAASWTGAADWAIADLIIAVDSAPTAVSATTPGSDSATETEGTPTTIAISATDSGSVVETWAISAALSGADTGTETDSNGTVSVGGSSPVGTDSFTVVESSSIVVTLSNADSGTTSESGTLAVTIAGADTATCAQASSTAVTLSQADSAAETDSGLVAATLAGADSATSTSSHTIGLSSTDLAQATDTQVIAVSFTNSDQFVFNDTGLILNLLSDHDDFTVTEDIKLSTGIGLAILSPVNRGLAVLTVVSRNSIATLSPVSRSAATLTVIAEPIADLEPL